MVLESNVQERMTTHVDRDHLLRRQKYHRQLLYEVHPLLLQQLEFRTLVLQGPQDQNFRNNLGRILNLLRDTTVANLYVEPVGQIAQHRKFQAMPLIL